jgi:hypothetical protein
MGLFSREPKKPETVDTSLPDGAWFAESERLFKSRIGGFYGSPDTMAEGGREYYGFGDFGTAMLFYAKSIDMLHTAYGFSRMQDRQPSPADASIVDGFVSALGASLSTHPKAPVGSALLEVEARLHDIAGECERLGLPSGLYRNAQAELRRYQSQLSP